MRDHQDVVIGVVQLINKKRDPKAVLQPVSLVDEQVISFTVGRRGSRRARSPARPRWPSRTPSSSSDIRKLFDEFVHAAVTAIEQRDPTTSGHSERVAMLTVGLAEKVDAAHDRPLRRDCASRATRSRSCATPRCSTTSARSRSRRSTCGKGKKLYAGADDRDPPALRLHPQDASRPSTCGPGSRRSSPGAPARTTSRRSTRSTRGGAPRRSACSRRCSSANEPTVVEEESFRALMNLPTRRFASFEDAGGLPGGGLGRGALPDRGGGRGALDPQGQPVRRGAPRDREPRHAHLRVPAEDPVDGRARGASPRSPGPTTRSSTARATRAGSRRRRSRCSPG